ncbi:MAG: tRNA preQ1(34) S-adenosylmethionine ribosyltransferase-isomerase QueA [Myxococcota bacterium]
MTDTRPKTFVLGEGADPEHTDAYDYRLPRERIAATPPAERGTARMMVARHGLPLEHATFADLPGVLSAGDLLVFNDTRVLPARVMAERADTGGKIELLVLQRLSTTGESVRWSAPVEDQVLVVRAMARGAKKLSPGRRLLLRADGAARSAVVRQKQGAQVELALTLEPNEDALHVLERFGALPLPPYIVRRREELGLPALSFDDEERYQTVYAREPGAVAAPTAGLHLTHELLRRLEGAGVRTVATTLHVGAGTFKPVSADTLDAHVMHHESYRVTQELAHAVQRAREAGGRVIAVGTTSARVLEAEARLERPFVPGWRSTNIFLKPGREPLMCDGLITNFHLPRSTLLALVAAFMGYDQMRECYEAAVAEGYMFYSYGDGMVILRDSGPR